DGCSRRSFNTGHWEKYAAGVEPVLNVHRSMNFNTGYRGGTMLKRRAGVEDDQKLMTQHRLNAAGVGSAVAGVDEVTSDRTFAILLVYICSDRGERKRLFFSTFAE